MQITISQQLGLDLSTVGNFFMNARRRSQDKWLDEQNALNSNSNTCSSLNANDFNNGLSNQGHLMGNSFPANCSLANSVQPSNAMSSIVLNNAANSSVINAASSMLPSTNAGLVGCGLNSKLVTNSSNSNCSSQSSSLASPSSTTSPHLTRKLLLRINRRWIGERKIFWDLSNSLFFKLVRPFTMVQMARLLIRSLSLPAAYNF